MKYCFDLDETICLTPSDRQYKNAIPYTPVVERINSLYEEGHEITIFTARGSSSGIDYSDLNREQLSRWGVKYHKLIDKGKPSYDLFVDDKAISASEWRKEERIQIVGFVASCFDLLHAGHCLYLKEAKSVCDYLVGCTTNRIKYPQVSCIISSFSPNKIRLESHTFYSINSSCSSIKNSLKILTGIRNRRSW